MATNKRKRKRGVTKVFIYWKGTSPFYLNQIFVPSRNACKTRFHMGLGISLKKISLGQRSISFMGLSIWTKLNNGLTILNNTISFIHNY